MSVPGGVPLSAVQTTKSGARDDCFGQFLVLVSRVWGASRHIEPEAGLVKQILRAAKATDHLLTEDEVHLIIKEFKASGGG